jgi:hypothetical protein
MAEATATAVSGQVRLQRRAWTTSRGCWRLVVLLGLAWLALVLLGGTAHADPADVRRDASAPTAPRPAAPDALPLLGQTLADVGTLASAPLEQVAQVVTTTTQTVAAAVPAAAPASAPALSMAAASELADSVRATAVATATGPELLDVRLPSFEATIVPVVSGAAEQVHQAVHQAADAVTVLSAPVPLVQPLHDAVAPVLGVVDLTRDVLASTGSFVGVTADAVVDRAADTLVPVLAAVSGPAGAIVVSGPGAAGAAGLPAPQPDLSTVIPGSQATATALPSGAVNGDDATCLEGTPGLPAVPPPDTTDSSTTVAHPASDTTTVAPVPVSGAGSTTGSGGGSAPTPGADLTLVRVESEPEHAAGTTGQPIEGPTGPMPGTPAADPVVLP